MRAEDYCNPSLQIKDSPDIWPAINRVAGCHLPRCLACGLQVCQMGIMSPQDTFQAASEASKLQGQAVNNIKHLFNIVFHSRQSFSSLPEVYLDFI